MQPPRCTCDDNLKGIGPCPVHGLIGKKTYEEADCCTYCGGDLGLIRMCSNCIEKCRKATERPGPSGSNESTGSIASPWPARDIVAKLVEAANILLDDKSYDGHGWEQIQVAKTEAAKWLEQ